MTRRVPRALLVLTSLLLLTAGCGSDGESPTARPAPTSTPPVEPGPGPDTDTGSSVPAVVPPSATRTPSRLPSRPTDVFEKIRVVGTVVEAQSACVEIEDANGIRWSLLGPETVDLSPGQQVQVTGRSRPEAPGCTGIPLLAQRVLVVG